MRLVLSGGGTGGHVSRRSPSAHPLRRSLKPGDTLDILTRGAGGQESDIVSTPGSQ